MHTVYFQQRVSRTQFAALSCDLFRQSSGFLRSECHHFQHQTEHSGSREPLLHCTAPLYGSLPILSCLFHPSPCYVPLFLLIPLLFLLSTKYLPFKPFLPTYFLLSVFPISPHSSGWKAQPLSLYTKNSLRFSGYSWLLSWIEAA